MLKIESIWHEKLIWFALRYTHPAQTNAQINAQIKFPMTSVPFP